MVEPLLRQTRGYECEFVDPLSDALCCHVCSLPYRDPHLLACCGKKICEPCIEQIRLVSKPCPFCNQPGLLSMLDKELRASVLDLKVFCLNKSSGCEWQGELRDIQNHRANCDFVHEACRYQCGQSFPRRRLSKHERDECPQRPQDMKTQSLVRKLEKKFAKRITQLEADVKLHEETYKAAMDAQATRFDKLLREQKETYEQKISELAQQLKAHEDQLFSPPCKLAMPVNSQHKILNNCWFSPPFHTNPGGYKMCLGVYANGYGEGAGTHVSVFVHFMRGMEDDNLKWPFQGNITVQLLNQKRDWGHVEAIIKYSDEALAHGYGVRVTLQECGSGWGNCKFISHTSVESTNEITQYLHNDCLTFRISCVVVHSM